MAISCSAQNLFLALHKGINPGGSWRTLGSDQTGVEPMQNKSLSDCTNSQASNATFLHSL